MRSFASALLVLALSLTACGGDATRPESGGTPTLHGQITTTDGTPIPGARVTLQFGVDGVDLPGWDDPAKAARILLNYTSSTPGTIRLEILDYARHGVRVLFYGFSEGGPASVAWDATDDAGDPVVPGVYVARLTLSPADQDQPDQISEHIVMLYFADEQELFDRPHTFTDADGRYSIPLETFGVGVPMWVTDELGASEEVEVSHRVQVHAFVGIDTPTAATKRYVTVSNLEDPVRLDLVLPR